MSDNIIVESQNYPSMFNKMLSELDRIITPMIPDNPSLDGIHQMVKNNTIRTIKNAKKVLKRNDRIVWYLKYARSSIISTFRGKVISQSLYLRDTLNSSPYNGMGENHNDVLMKLEHYLSLPIPAIQNYVFQPNDRFTDIEDDFREFEKEWQESRAGYVEGEDTDEIVIKFPDGFAWVNLHKPHCKLEGDAMGHCGNTAASQSGDTILSLRKYDEAKGMWRPSLTFILHEDGMLGEMKGRANEKPAAKYHSYIKELLKHPMVKGIMGGGYAPENNFAMDDLSESDRMELLTVKPTLDLLTVYTLAQNDEAMRNALGQGIAETVKNRWNIDAKNLTGGWVSFPPTLHDFVPSAVSDFMGNRIGYRELADYMSQDQREAYLEKLQTYSFVGPAKLSAETAHLKTFLDENMDYINECLKPLGIIIRRWTTDGMLKPSGFLSFRIAVDVDCAAMSEMDAQLVLTRVGNRSGSFFYSLVFSRVFELKNIVDPAKWEPNKETFQKNFAELSNGWMNK